MSDTHAIVGPEEPIVWEQFETIEQQEEANTLGIWLFLAQELMFFGGLFCAYGVYRMKFPDEFVVGSLQLSVLWGGINTTILLASSVTMALAVYFTQNSKLKWQIWMMLATFVLGVAFLTIKWSIEWPEKYGHGLIPGETLWGPDMQHVLHVAHDKGAEITAVSESALQMFFVLYFIMTSMHALHMLIGFGILAWLLVMSLKRTYGENRYLPIEFFGFYWHLVDIIWVFLFPLFYLIR